MSDKKLSKDSTLNELFNHIYNPDEDVQVLPVTMSKPEDPLARMMIVIQGKQETSQHIMANLMYRVQEMHDLAEQNAATNPPNEIVGSDGEAIEDEPKIKLIS